MTNTFLTKLGIRFADNDFYNTMRGFLTLISIDGVDAYGSKNNPEALKKKICDLFMATALEIYCVCQKKSHKYDNMNLQTYFKLKTADVFVGEEVDQYLFAAQGWDNSEFFYLDEFGNFNCI
jgi:hypothetical protein